MTLASDQSNNDAHLSHTARRLLALRDDVFAAWERRVRERLSQATELEHPILLNTLPVFFDNIVESISPGHPRTSAVDGTTVAAEHGGERARVTAYDHASLIEEYQILRWAIFDVLHENSVALDRREIHTINSSLDSGIQEAVEAFLLVHSGFRERFAAALIHDLRSPLATVVGALELILITDDLTRVKAVAAKALSNAVRMSGMINELLDTMAFHGGKGIELTLARVDICEVIEEVRTDALLTLGQNIHVINCSAKGWWDRSALKRAVENLVSNAVKYGSPNTPITIKSEEVQGRLVLSVHNEGLPIPPHEQECIFQMYQRAESAKNDAKQGWGIGLPYIRAVAESHGGSMGLDSSEERGTTFIIDIPLDARLVPNAPTLALG